MGLGRESAAPSRPPPARSAPSAREPLDLIQRPAFLPRPYKNGARSPGPQTLDHLLSPSLSSLHPRPSERTRATTASGAERLAGVEGGHGAAELRSPEVRAANACAQLRRAALVGALRHPPTAPRSGVAATAVSGSGERPVTSASWRAQGVGTAGAGGCEAARDQVPSARSPSVTAMAAAMATVVALMAL